MSLLLRALAAAAVVALVAVVARRSGPVLAGIILGFPVIIGTTLLFTAPHGSTALTRLAVGALWAMIPLSAFLASVIVSGRWLHLTAYPALGVGMGVWVILALLVLRLQHA